MKRWGSPVGSNSVRVHRFTLRLTREQTLPARTPTWTAGKMRTSIGNASFILDEQCGRYSTEDTRWPTNVGGVGVEHACLPLLNESPKIGPSTTRPGPERYLIPRLRVFRSHASRAPLCMTTSRVGREKWHTRLDFQSRGVGLGLKDLGTLCSRP